MSSKYSQAGVSLEAGYESVRRIKSHVDRTKRKGSIDSLGAFGGMFDLSELGMKEPVLVSGTDGVGTKLLLAIEMDKHDTIGQDVVAMCVNDVLVQGAMPLYFLDYIAVGKNSPAQIESIVSGVADGCVMAGCALIGGETAEMPGMYSHNHYDIAGFTVGAVEKKNLITGKEIKEGDAILGLKSSGVHSNGFSLVRKILKDNDIKLSHSVDFSDKSIGELLLSPTKIYVKTIKALLQGVKISGMSHITGGGFYENIPRVIPEELAAKLDLRDYKVPELFKYLGKMGNMTFDEMANVFNLGVGFILIVDRNEVEKVKEILDSLGEEMLTLGEIGKKKNSQVEIKW